jgi:hypothetical protein
MRENTRQQLEQSYAEFPRTRAEGVPYAEIASVAAAMGAVLPDDYIEFIHRYGGGYVGPYLIFGLRKCEWASASPRCLLDEETTYYRREQWPGFRSDWIAIGNDHSGNPFCLAPDGRVWVADHDVGEALLVASDFEEFLRKECLEVPD